MERVLQHDSGVMNLRIFRLGNDLKIKEGSKIPLVLVDNPYLQEKEGDIENVIGYIKVDCYRRMGSCSELVGDLFLNSKKDTKRLFKHLKNQQDVSLSGISDLLHLHDNNGLHFTITL